MKKKTEVSAQFITVDHERQEHPSDTTTTTVACATTDSSSHIRWILLQSILLPSSFSLFAKESDVRSFGRERLGRFTSPKIPNVTLGALTRLLLLFPFVSTLHDNPLPTSDPFSCDPPANITTLCWKKQCQLRGPVHHSKRIDRI